MRAAFYTLGCKVNQYETAALARQFAAGGFDIVEPEEEADVYVVNSCTVTATGDKKSRQALRRFKRRNPAAVACLCGCFPQAFPDAAERIPEADVIMGAANRGALLGAVRKRMEGGERIIDIEPHREGEGFEPMSAGPRTGRTRAFVKIEDGCERHCTYCVIPRARGPVRSKAPGDLLRELEELAAGGYREVVLVGINLSSYGLDLGGKLLDAVELACGVEGISRVRLGSLEPELLTGEDIRALAAQPKLCGQFHLSLQSGCDATLRRMGRHYDTAEYRRIVEDLRRHFPGCAITTDIMAGFPGETEEEFAQTLAFVREMAFARAHVFAYSLRPGTPAERIPGHVDGEVKARRAGELARACGEGEQAYLQAQVGRVLEVLLEAPVKGGLWEGYSATYVPVRVPWSGADPAGQIRRVSITGVEGEYCTGWPE